MSLVTQITDLITRMGTEIKSMKSTYSGNTTGSINSLITSDKSSLLGAINELKTEVGGKQTSLGYTPENAAKKGTVNGYAALDGTGKVPMAQLPDVLNKNKGWYSTSAALITAFPSASSGDYAIVGATDTVWIWDTDGTPSWKDGDTKGAVVSVNGQTGAVTLSFEAPITAGTTSQFWRGDKTWQDLFTQVRAATLTGLSTATNAVITATDTVLGALGKLQKQVSDNLTSFTSHTTSHPAPTVRDARNQVAGSYETAFSKNTAFNKNFGTAVDTVCQGNDSRLSDARTPTAHTHTASQITDFTTAVTNIAYSEAEIGDITTNFVTAFNTAIA